MTALAGAVLGTALISLGPDDKPLVTIYMHPDCGSCRRWREHLVARGFRTEIGRQSDWADLRSKFGITTQLQSSHSALVDGLFLEGPVPAHDSHQALKRRSSEHIVGLVVPGVPGGSPGMEAALPQPYTVLAIADDGSVRKFAHHGH